MTDEVRPSLRPGPLPSPWGRWLARAVGLTLLLGASGAEARRTEPAPAPPSLRDTGLYSDFAQHTVAAGTLEYSPQYPLWTDGADKRRWFRLPPGTSIDASNPDAWVFPRGTRFWKEFSFGGRRVETRYLQRQQDGSWLFATYAWSEDGLEARLVADKGQAGAYAFGAGRWHQIPSVAECKICHEGGRAQVLGFDALQLSPDRDPNALHAGPATGVDLDYLVKNNLLKHLPQALRDSPPRIAAATPTERAAVGYLHGNCGHCHNDVGLLQNLGLSLHHDPAGEPEAPERALATTVGQPLKTRAPGLTQDAVVRVEAGEPAHSALLQRISSRYAALQMPPLGTVLLDGEAIALLSRWIAENPTPTRVRGLSGSASNTTP